MKKILFMSFAVLLLSGIHVVCSPVTVGLRTLYKI